MLAEHRLDSGPLDASRLGRISSQHLIVTTHPKERRSISARPDVEVALGISIQRQTHHPGRAAPGDPVLHGDLGDVPGWCLVDALADPSTHDAP